MKASLARLRQSKGRSDEASTLTTPTYGWFTEGFDSADHKEAKALLYGTGVRDSGGS
jgi:hypothetical protein